MHACMYGWSRYWVVQFGSSLKKIIIARQINLNYLSFSVIFPFSPLILKFHALPGVKPNVPSLYPRVQDCTGQPIQPRMNQEKKKRKRRSHLYNISFKLCANKTKNGLTDWLESRYSLFVRIRPKLFYFFLCVIRFICVRRVFCYSCISSSPCESQSVIQARAALFISSDLNSCSTYVP